MTESLEILVVDPQSESSVTIAENRLNDILAFSEECQINPLEAGGRLVYTVTYSTEDDDADLEDDDEELDDADEAED